MLGYVLVVCPQYQDEQTYLCRAPSIPNIPSEGSKFHGKDHLGSRDLDGFVAAFVECSDYMAAQSVNKRMHAVRRCSLDRQMSHGET